MLARAGLTVAGLLAAPGGVAGFEQTDLERLRQIGHCPACDLRGAGAAVRTQDRCRERLGDDVEQRAQHAVLGLDDSDVDLENPKRLDLVDHLPLQRNVGQRSRPSASRWFGCRDRYAGGVTGTVLASTPP